MCTCAHTHTDSHTKRHIVRGITVCIPKVMKKAQIDIHVNLDISAFFELVVVNDQIEGELQYIKI